jgi:hypothetical protein
VAAISVKTVLVVGVVVLLAAGTTKLVLRARAVAAVKKTDPVAYKVLYERSTLSAGELKRQMVGVWEMVAFRPWNSRRLAYLPENNNHLRIFTETNWSIIYQDARSNVVYSASGSYTLKGNVYLESVETATGTMTPYLGQRSKYKIRADGDHYYQMGVNDRPMEEMWRRLPQ